MIVDPYLRKEAEGRHEITTGMVVRAEIARRKACDEALSAYACGQTRASLAGYDQGLMGMLSLNQASTSFTKKKGREGAEG